MADSSQKLTARALTAMQDARATGEQVPVIIRFAPTRDIGGFRTRAAAISTLSINRQFSLVPSVAATVDAAGMEQLAQMDDVDQIWFDEPVHTMLDVSVPRLRAPQVWSELGNRGAGVTICVVDTGIDPNHPDFVDRIGLSEDFSGKGSVQDGNGHGTHVASIAAGSGAAEDGKYSGVAPEATLMVAKVLTDRGSGRMSDVMAGVEWAVQNGAQVINLSLGSDGSSDGRDALSTICNAAVDLGKVVVAAAGNAGPAARTVGSPGAATQVITVGASDDNDQVTDFSSRGPTADGRVKPDIVAPGAGIVAARADATLLGTPQGKYYTSANGTSMATPHVSGLCALLLAQEPTLAPSQVKSRLQETARNLNLPDNSQGRGRVDAAAALQLAPVEPVEPVEPTPEPPPTPSPPLGCLGTVLKLVGLV